MAATERQRIPAALRGKLSPLPFMFVDHRTFWLLIGLGLAAFIGFYPADGYGLVYVLGPPLSLLAAGVAWTISPFKPYRGEHLAKKRPVDKNDPAAMRLVELFKSDEAHAALWRAAARLTGWLLLASLAVAVIRHRPLNWHIPPPDHIGNVVASAFFSWLALGVEYIAWGLRTWAEREMSREVHG